MCHGNLRHREERMEEARGERLWDLFRRETERPAPAEPVAERDPEPEEEELLAGAPRQANDLH